MTLSEFLRNNGVSHVAHSKAGTSLNFTNGSQLVATIARIEVEDSDNARFQYVKERLNWSVQLNNQGFMTLSEPVAATSLNALWEEPANAAKKVKA